MALAACSVDSRTPDVADPAAGVGASSNPEGAGRLPGVVQAPGAAGQSAAGTGTNTTDGRRGAALPVVPSATSGAASGGAAGGAPAGSEQATETGQEAPPVETTLPLPAAHLATRLWAVGAEGIGPGLFNDARSVGVDASGVIYVVEYTSEAPTRVQRFAADGSFIGQWFTVDEPLVNDIVVDRNGKLYLLQSGPIYLYDGTSGSKLGSLEVPLYSESPNAIALTPDNGLLRVGQNQILRLDAAGQIVLDVRDTIDPVLDNSFLLDGATMDGLSNMYFIASTDPTIYKFNAEGVFQDRIGTQGRGVGLFDTFPDAIAVDGSGRIYADDFDGIEVFEPDGSSRGMLPGSARDMVVSDQNELIVLDYVDYKLIKYQLPL